jgi:hypothetical protein
VRGLGCRVWGAGFGVQGLGCRVKGGAGFGVQGLGNKFKDAGIKCKGLGASRAWGLEVHMGGVTHCSLHCRSAKVSGLMIKGKCGAVIG